jgi:hypothetical protein
VTPTQHAFYYWSDRLVLIATSAHYCNDQFYNGGRVSALGVAAAVDHRA